MKTTISLIMMLATFGFAHAASQMDPLQARTSHLKLARVTRLDAVMALAGNAKVPLGVVCPDPEFMGAEISLETNRQTMAEALSAVIAGASDMRLDVDHGVIVVQRIALPPECAFLDSVIPVLIVPKDTVVHVSALLWMTLEPQLDASKTGFMGILHPDANDRDIGPAELRGRRVRDVLNWMVREHGAAAWVSWPCLEVGSAASDQLWKLVFFRSR